jgi:hypothetical protein
MRVQRMIMLGSAVALLGAAPLARGDWSFGPNVSYLSGISDVVDVYERNLLAEPGVVEVDTAHLPFGVGFLGHYQADNGLRVDFGAGPVFVMLGVESDTISGDHVELPLYATVGYTFSPEADRSAYARVGAAYHIVSGDYERSSDPGLCAAFGLELGRSDGSPWGFELAFDDSTVKFVDPAIAGRRKLHTYDTMLSFFFLF